MCSSDLATVDASVEIRSGFAGQPFHVTVAPGQRTVVQLTLNSVSGPVTVRSDQLVYVGRRIGSRRVVTARTVGIVVG